LIRIFLAAAATISAGLISVGYAQTQPPQRVPLAEEVFKNVPLLRGMPVDEFMDTMGMFASATSLNCTDCHTADTNDSWGNFADETPLKQTARRMIVMVNTINKMNFGGQRRVTCFTCHQGTPRPKDIPNLAIQYGAPAEDPNDIDLVVPNIPGLPTGAQLLDNYIKAIGGPARLGALASYIARGTYSGFDTGHVDVAVEIYARAPDQRATVVRAPFGDKVSTYDGRTAWVSSADRPIPLMPLTGGNLDGARIDALVTFPAQIRQAFGQWRVGTTTIDDREVYIAQGTRAGRLPVNFYFDQESALLVRTVRWNDTAVGRVPTQTDYADYRDVAGVKLPFRITATWTNGQHTITLTDVQANAPIDAARFGRPAPAPPPKLQ
jgi:photosynthetic reaction center cytochrome c subunit